MLWDIIGSDNLWVGIIVWNGRLKQILLGENKEDMLPVMRKGENGVCSKIDVKSTCKRTKSSSRVVFPSKQLACPSRLSDVWDKESSLVLLEAVKKDLNLYLRQEKIHFPDYPFTSNLSPFTWKVLAEVRKIPYGKLRTYKWVAQKISCKAYRAVGHALGKNPFPIIIPCHRVVRTDGTLGGFSSGITLKKKLLWLESVPDEQIK